MTDFQGILAKKTATLPTDQPCPCGSGRHYGDCCQPLIEQNTPAPSAEALMRSRFSAYALRQTGYVEQSWHSSTRPENLTLEPGVQWTRLEVLGSANGDNPDEAFVEFMAYCKVNGSPQSLHELSRFLREDGEWRYVDGTTPKTLRKPVEKVGRNDPCPCGSGKKFKRCCG